MLFKKFKKWDDKIFALLALHIQSLGTFGKLSQMNYEKYFL
jgi:hypothetical protein